MGDEASMSAPASERERVLVIDDDDSVRRLIARMVSTSGHDVETAADAVEARLWLAMASFALVICDLNMPGESGHDLVRWIRAEHRDVAVLMATGTNDRGIADAVLAAGAYGYLLKPFRRNEVAINVANALRRRGLEIENREYRGRLELLVAERTGALREAVERLEASEWELTRSREETIQRLSLAIEFRSHETGEHVERIGINAARIAGRLGLDERHCEMIRLAAVLHDVGKIGIPDAILLKPGPLNGAERRQIEQHPEIGHRLLAGSGSELLELAAQIAWSHHERFDGGGYPRGLAGEDAPLEGRITAVADVFDALTHDRVYRPALPLDQALEIMRAGRGRQFDPDVLDAFMDLLGDMLEIEGRNGFDVRR
jgi:putative two-component system response regulator